MLVVFVLYQSHIASFANKLKAQYIRGSTGTTLGREGEKICKVWGREAPPPSSRSPPSGEIEKKSKGRVLWALMGKYYILIILKYFEWRYRFDSFYLDEKLSDECN